MNIADMMGLTRREIAAAHLAVLAEYVSAGAHGADNSQIQVVAEEAVDAIIAAVLEALEQPRERVQ